MNYMKTVKKEIIPLAISILLILISFGVILSTNYILSIEHYIGIGLLILSIILYSKRYDLYLYVFTLTLLAGLIGLIDFYYTTFKIGVGAFAINPIFLVLILLFLALNKDKLNTMFPEKNQSNILTHMKNKSLFSKLNFRISQKWNY